MYINQWARTQSNICAIVDGSQLFVYFLHGDIMFAHKKDPGLEIKEFCASNFYSEAVFNNKDPLTTYYSVNITKEGTKLVAQYYREKYHADITVFSDEYNFAHYISTFRSHGNICKAFILFLRKSSHPIPIIYIKENNDEGLLFADSFGTSEDVAKKLAKHYKIPIYYTPEKRQLDNISSSIDALIIARDAIACPNLLNKLKIRSQRKLGNIYQVKLPDELLKTAQSSAFMKIHQESGNRIIYKTETLTLFRNRYRKELKFIENNKKSKPVIVNKLMPNYLRAKGFKLQKIIEIQFYINQLKKCLGDAWTKELREEFIKEAKPMKFELNGFCKVFLETRKVSSVQLKNG